MIDDNKILILGVGNLLLGDEGVGIHAISALSKRPISHEVRLLDGGTGGFHLLSEIEDYEEVIIIDATMDGQQAGTVSVIKPKFASDYPPSLSAHDVGLKDLISALYLLGKVPQVTLIVVSITGIQPMRITLSDEVHEAIPLIIDLVEKYKAVGIEI